MFSGKINIQNQWQIQDFPLGGGGHRVIGGGVPTSNTGTFQ